MTTQYAVIDAPTGQTLTAKLFTKAAPDTVAFTADSVTERTNAKGEYLCTFGEASVISGIHTLILFSGSTPVAKGERTFKGTDTETALDATNVLKDRMGYLLTPIVGNCADPQTASETYTRTLDGENFTVDYSGLDASGTRTTTTLTKA